MFIFMTIVIFFVVLIGWEFFKGFFNVPGRKRKFPKLLEEVFAIFKKFQYSKDISLSLGLFLSSNDDKDVADIYNKPKNLEIAQKTVIKMWSRG